MEVHIPNQKEIYMIAYLAANGWSLDYAGEVWTKQGFSHGVWCDRQEKKINSADYTLIQAYDAQVEWEE